MSDWFVRQGSNIEDLVPLGCCDHREVSAEALDVGVQRISLARSDEDVADVVFAKQVDRVRCEGVDRANVALPLGGVDAPALEVGRKEDQGGASGEGGNHRVVLHAGDEDGIGSCLFPHLLGEVELGA